MSNSKKSCYGKRVITPVGRCAFMSVFKPKKQLGGDEEKYEVTLLFPKSADISVITNSVRNLVKEHFGDNVPDKFNYPFKDGDKPNTKGNIHKGYPGHVAVTAKSKSPIGIVDGQKCEILNSNEFVSGDYAIASMTPFLYNQGSNIGVTLFLGNIQKIRKGEPFGAFVSAEEEFDAVPEGGTDKKGVFKEPDEAVATETAPNDQPAWMK